MQEYKKSTTTVYAVNALQILLFALFMYLQLTAINTLARFWDDRVSSQLESAAALADLERELGYGGFIHHFKNYVLRGGDEFYQEALEHYSFAQQALQHSQDIARKLQDEESLTDLAVLQTTLGEYREKLEVARSEHANLTPDQLDIRVKVDDAAADVALKNLHSRILPRQQVLSESLQTQVNSIETKTIVLGVLLIPTFILANFLSIRLIRYLQLASDRLGENVQSLEAAEAKARISSERFELAATGASVGIWDWVDTNDQYVYWSSRFYQLIGYLPEELESGVENFSKIMHPDDRDMLFDAINQHLEHDAPYDVEYRIEVKGKGYRWFRGTGRCARDTQGKAIRMVGSIEDIHDKKMQQIHNQQLVDSLIQTNKELEQFAYVASHDLKAPLRAVVQLAGWIEEDLQDPDPKTLEHFTLLKSRVTRMEKLLGDLLAYSRIGKSDESLSRFRPREVIESVFELFEDQHCELLFAGDDAEIESYKQPFEMVIRNLINNAIKHNDKEIAEVNIVLSDVGENLRFLVTDNGPGIEPQYHDRIFELFKTLKPRDEVEGSGMGLALVKKAIEEAGGSITLTSEPGMGCEFVFILPKRYSEMVMAISA